MYFGPDIINQTGIEPPGIPKERFLILLNLPLAFMNALGSGLAMLVIDRMGRRYIMLRTIPMIVVACMLVSLSMYLTNYGESDGTVKAGDYLAIISMLLYLAFFSIGWSSTVWSVNTEIYPLHLAGTGSAIATATNWFTNFLVSTFFLSIMTNSDAGKVYAFMILAGFSVLAFIFVYKLLPETKGKAITQNI
jgi:SP family myo-inositol transporter-like MFS transporter 13